MDISTTTKAAVLAGALTLSANESKAQNLSEEEVITEFKAIFSFGTKSKRKRLSYGVI